jgi:hypothetical protein
LDGAACPSKRLNVQFVTRRLLDPAEAVVAMSQFGRGGAG